MNGPEAPGAPAPAVQAPPRHHTPSAAGRPRAGESEARAQALVDAAARLFLAKGYARTSLEQIARTARVAVRTIYVKFGGKPGLLRAVVTANRHVFFDGMPDLCGTPAPMREVLVDFGKRMNGLMTSPTMISLHRMVIAEVDDDPELAGAFYDAGPRQTREMLRRYFSRPAVRAQLRDLPADVLALHLLDCVMGDLQLIYLGRPARDDGGDAGRLVERRIDLFLHGVRN